ncbi:ubiquitin thioesterase trabid-like [Drosophila erecta]|uniref:ubiquitin thioesterase trabid-like n=1 Tax=Drosophila erecta TaxID=7220 RepID=UPI000F048E82|nr:ubiquitin thioesterase trabid-like [Drosophila erecta]
MSPTPSSTCYSLQPQNQARQSNVADSKKWPCKVCTYLNWPRSLRCVQCCTKRGGETIERGNKDMDNEADADRAGEALQALRISGSEENLANKPGQLIGATASNLAENWPRSIKCSMCGKTRERKISGSQNDRSSQTWIPSASITRSIRSTFTNWVPRKPSTTVIRCKSGRSAASVKSDDRWTGSG